jgi:hypothetical protein
MVAQHETGGHLKWVPSISSAESSDTLDADYQDRFDAAVEHAERQGQSNLWPMFYKARAAAQHATTSRLSGSVNSAQADRVHGHGVGAEFRRILGGVPKHPSSQPEQMMERLITEVEKDDCIRNQVNTAIEYIVNSVAGIPTVGVAVVARRGVAALRQTQFPKKAPLQTWPAEQELIEPVSYADQLTLCLRKRGGLVSDRHKVSARLRLPAKQRALQRKMLADWAQPSADSVTDVNQKLRGAFGARKFRPGTWDKQ